MKSARTLSIAPRTDVLSESAKIATSATSASPTMSAAAVAEVLERNGIYVAGLVLISGDLGIGSLSAPLATALQTAIEKIEVCRQCGNIDSQNPCTVCTDPRRDPSIIVVVADVADLWALERAHAVNARYHVLGGTLSPLDGIGPEDLPLGDLVSRITEDGVREVILATPPSVDGEATALLLARELSSMGVQVSRIASGIPHGGELEFADQITLGRAIDDRRAIGTR